MSSQKEVLVLGGKGFIGRHAVKHLVSAGARVTIGTRSPNRHESNGVKEEEYVLHKATSQSDWQDAAEKFDVILNCVGILRQRFRESYDAVHHLAPEAIAKACAETDTRFVHVSALGLSSQAKSRFLTSKYFGEQAIAATASDWIVARLSLLDGEGGYGAAWLRGVARLPFFIVPTSATGRIAALTADDAGEALSHLCMKSADTLDLAEQREFELGGEHPLSFESYIRGLRQRHSEVSAVAIPVPGILARLFAHLCDVVHFSPFSFGHWELLCYDNVPETAQLRALLERAPCRVVADAL